LVLGAVPYEHPPLLGDALGEYIVRCTPKRRRLYWIEDL